MVDIKMISNTPGNQLGFYNLILFIGPDEKINCKSWEFCSNKVTNLFFIKTIIWLNL